MPDSRPSTAPGERKRELGIYLAYRLAEWLINRVPRRIALPLASAAGNLAFDFGADKRELICANLSRPMRLPASHGRVRRAARRAFRNYAKYLVDMMRIGEMTDHQVEALVTIENIDSLRTASAEGKGVLLCTVHVGGMDLLGPALNRLGESLHVIADDTTYGRLYDHLAQARGRHRIFLIGWRNLRGLFKVLRGGGNLVLFCDGGYRRGDVPVEFCGEATTFPAGPATIAARSGAPILPVWCRRTAEEGFEARGLPLIRAASNDPAEIQRATQALADALSRELAGDPDQWYMFRAVWPQSPADRAQAVAALEAARRGDDWTRLPQATAA